MDCNDAMNAFLALDNDEALAPEVAAHLLTCSACRETVQKMQYAMSIMSRLDEDVVADGAITEAVLARISREVPGVVFESDQRQISVGGWVAVGVIIVASIVATSFSDPLRWMSTSVGTGIDFPLNLVLGGVLTAYLLLFVGSHLKLISRWLRLRIQTD